LYLEFSE